MIKCSNGHYYDEKKDTSCPYCLCSLSDENLERISFIGMCDSQHKYNTLKHDTCPYCEQLANTLWSPTRSSKMGVVAISDRLVAKVFYDKFALENESKKLKFANSINDLFVKFERNVFLENSSLLVMERLFPLEFRAYEFDKKLDFFIKFKKSMDELHDNGFVFRDIRATIVGDRSRECPNIILTHQGLRLIDAEIAILKEEVNAETFQKYVEEEKKEIDGYFKDYFLFDM